MLPSPPLSVEVDASGVAQIRLDHLRHNARVLQRLAKPARLMAVVKADAYGLGAHRIARSLEAEGVEHFAVATLAEGIDLREAGLTGTILVLGAPLPRSLPRYAPYQLDITVPSLDIARALAQVADPATRYRVHVKVDTGMNRIGLPLHEVPEAIRVLTGSQFIEVDGIWTHLASASNPDVSFAEEQLRAFDRVLDDLPIAPRFVHVAASSSLVFLARSLQFPSYPLALVRPGLSLHGITRAATSLQQAQAADLDLRPVLSLHAPITHLHVAPAGSTVSYDRTWTARTDSLIATIGLGYADGYLRSLSNRGQVSFRGRRYPVVGKVCMDMMMAHLGDPDQHPWKSYLGETVTLFGGEGPSVSEVASWAGTTPYEIFCRLGPRVRRVYLDEDQPLSPSSP